MRLTKYTHACVRLEKSGSALVIDPGTFSEVEDALDGADAFLVTHEHPDHLDVERSLAALRGNPSLEAWAPEKVASQLREGEQGVADRVHVAEPETEFTAGGFRVRTFGSQHALIHPLVPVVANIGYLVDESVFHPGDSFTVPHGVQVETLLVPIHAPWNKISEVIDFIIAVGAQRAFPIHNALINDRGTGIVEGHAQRIGGMYGTAYQHLEPGESVEI